MESPTYAPLILTYDVRYSALGSFRDSGDNMPPPSLKITIPNTFSWRPKITLPLNVVRGLVANS